MEFFRPLDESRFVDSGFEGYTYQLLAYPEAGTFIYSRVGAGGHAADLHRHESDQLYYVVTGAMHVQLGAEVHQAGPDSLVFIPAGLPHRNWNAGPATECHFEMILPTPKPGRPILTLLDVDDFDPRLQERATVLSVRSPGNRRLDSGIAGLTVQRLADVESAGFRTTVDLVEVSQPSPGTGSRVQDLDQFCYVVEGTLGVDVACRADEATAGTLVVLPAGVCHRYWNAGGGLERHVLISAERR